ncbi:glycosyltransferase family 39 protein [Candidatus Gottesmanbacteria bacterium]|nr:glycosyltransferase family 39 protein [Candidatus Gottesmanbacteria bacterium]
MKKPLGIVINVSAAYIVWRVALWIIESVAPAFWPLYQRFLGPSYWANLDGVYYLTIARGGYGPYQQAFFPLYPLLIRWITVLTGINDISVSLIISHISFYLGILLFYALAEDYNKSTARWGLLLFLVFPTSFFFSAIYTESLFLFLSALCLFSSRKKWWLLAGISGGLASGTRMFGIFLFPAILCEYFSQKLRNRSILSFASLLLIPVGLCSYMAYLYFSIGDPFAFFHVQPAFGAERSGNTLIFLPQVIWRYMKIFTSVSPFSLTYAISVFEFAVLSGGLWVLWWGYKHHVRMLYLIYSLAILIIPTLTGTLSSLPRYVLSAFPLFFMFGSMHNMWIKILAFLIFMVGFILSATAFLRGYFIA